jgi:hypothetical protein
MEPKTNQIWSKKGIMHVENHARNNNIAFIHFDYHLNITILSRWVSVLNGKPIIKNC